MAEIGEIRVKRGYEIEWKIKDFLSYTDKDFCYSSPVFSISGSEWCLNVYPKGRSCKKLDDWICLYVEALRLASPSVCVSCNFGVKTAEGIVEPIRTETWIFQELQRNGFDKFLESSVMERRKSEIVPSSSLTLTCCIRKKEDFEFPRGLGILSRDFEELLISKRSCDVTLKVKEVEFPVHKLILSARSHVFASTFGADMKEETIEIEDCDPEAFKEFLRYLYSGRVENLSNKVFSELYKISSKYDVIDLKSYCVLSIVAAMAVENVLDAAIFGRKFEEGAIIRRAQEFFSSNFKRIIPTGEWDIFLKENLDIANELLKGMANTTSKWSLKKGNYLRYRHSSSESLI